MIRNAVVYDGPEKTLVDGYNLLPQRDKQGKYWDQEIVSSVRAKIKSHYVHEQEYRCCYCNKQILTNHGLVWTVEHVVAKASHPQFLFEPKNLSVSCHDCNIAKSDSRVLVNESRRTYPRESKDFKIVHPHFDDYSENIEIHAERIYLAKTEKGDETIRMCHLGRFTYKYVGRDEKLAEIDDLMPIFSDLMDATDKTTQKAKLNELSLAIHLMLSRTSS